MDLEKSDFKDIDFNFFINEEESVFNLFPDFGRYREFKMEFDNEMHEPHREDIIKMIILCYQSKSPLVKTEKDIIKRKIKAFNLLGIKPDRKSGLLPPEINAIIMGRNYQVQRMTAQFLKMQGNFKWSRLCALVESYYQTIAEATTDNDDQTQKSRLDLLEKVGVFENQIQTLEDELALGDTNLGHIISEMEMESEGKITDWPIYVARLKENGKWPPLSANTKSTTSKKK